MYCTVSRGKNQTMRRLSTKLLHLSAHNAALYQNHNSKLVYLCALPVFFAWSCLLPLKKLSLPKDEIRPLPQGEFSHSKRPYSISQALFIFFFCLRIFCLRRQFQKVLFVGQLCRQSKRKPAPLALFAFHPNPAAGQIDQHFTNMQA